MSKDISEYIHYYIGQPCTYDDPYQRAFDLIGVVTERIIQEIRNPQLTGAVKNARPHLRKMQDMTEEEMKEIWQIIFGRPFYERGTIQFFDLSKGSLSKRWVMTAEVDRVGIQWDGRIWADSDLELHKFNQHLVTHYLLKCGFDLFSLIDFGAALDAKTLQTQQQ